MKTSGSIKELLAAIAPALEQLWKQKEERVKKFANVLTQIQKIRGEISGTNEQTGSFTVDESDLSVKKLDEFHDHLQELEKEKVSNKHFTSSLKEVKILTHLPKTVMTNVKLMFCRVRD